MFTAIRIVEARLLRDITLANRLGLSVDDLIQDFEEKASREETLRKLENSLDSLAEGRDEVLQYRDAKGVILLDILSQGQCINAAQYCSTLDRLKEAIRRKRPGLLRRGVVLQHDNATPHSANLTQQWLQRYGWEILPHSAHSPDLAPYDFHLFGPLKSH
ncbi:histone-lysine N-methyltransferase SETMAR [Plakobranchus ocellatus]|uniref:Histone-lysine N-methyltransferase SETMAR n=1 Tax=Plakobranchus ocellatus TaxID=259542 RepID=A0AAV3YLW1_9GAST|nr:histone-lysine N-methyltransferase SETMAR [Plakobranchus ocellatus]